MSVLSTSLTVLEGAGIIALESYFGKRSVERRILWSDGSSASQGPGGLAVGGQGASGGPTTPQQELIPAVVVEERHHDEMVITQHPVERGSPISDHAYKLPAEVSIFAGWALASQFGRRGAPKLANLFPFAISSIIPRFGDGYYLQSLYETIRGLQTNRSMCTVITGKRTYNNMMVRSISTETDEHTENVLLVRMSFQEVFITDTKQIIVPPQENQANPTKTAPLVDRGPQALKGPANLGAASIVPGV